MAQTGEVRDELRKELLRNLEQVVQHKGLKTFDPSKTNYQSFDHITEVRETRKEADPRYWLVIHDKWVGKDLCTYIIVVGGMPEKLLGTQAWQVDEKKGKMNLRWVLPLDRKTDGVDMEKPSGLIWTRAQGAPLVN